ncbi:HAMP domain-containing histidine kinase [Clostridium sp. D2Q-14]|uniref:sensor histidine kinase n=1 Tax=Anaeromonas gelatinilytica TaxID=2683194 RepID=UPI00193C6D46|nr:HAMP domain-containing sensor histidine kinase [Anaeromonas gelatinilytica]MBS4534105.1 HAMP domain-containing histidine kinase [Anaeromonas gelatinilytica]
MRNYFINPQLKRSSMILSIIIITFFISIFLILNMQYNQLKDDYINSFGGIVSEIKEKDPELAQEIIPILVKETSQEQRDKGVEILKEYGLSRELENNLFPYINRTYRSNNEIFFSIFIMMLLLLLTFNYCYQVYFYKRIRRITSGAKSIVEGQYDTFIEEDQEGDFPKLVTAFNSMGGIIRNNLEELNGEKQFLVDLLSDISHQLKTPLSSMIVYNDIMLNKNLSREQQLTFLKNNENQLERMEWLIKSLLRLARLDVHAIKFERKNNDLNTTIEESIEMIESKAIEKKVSIDFSQDEKVFLEHDIYWLKEALMNIFINSIEHSNSGDKINVEILENPIYKRIIIEDQGEGISEEDLPNIFRRFYKSKRSQKSDSVGIGLALSKAIIGGHGGIIEAESQLGEGTKFIITFLKY